MKKHNFIILCLVGFMGGYVYYKFKTTKQFTKDFEEEVTIEPNKDYENDFRKFNEYSFGKRKYIKVQGAGDNF